MKNKEELEAKIVELEIERDYWKARYYVEIGVRPLGSLQAEAVSELMSADFKDESC